MRLKRKTKSILTGILSVGLIAGILAGAIALFGGTTKTVSSFEFSVGAIDENGNHIKNSKQAIYTEDLIECQGLTIEADYEADGTYQVFYYDSDKRFIGSTDTMRTSDGVYSKNDTFVTAKYCRIMITPATPVDEDGKVEENFKIRFYEVHGYANDYTITVDKKQNFKLNNYFVAVEDIIDKCYVGSNGVLLEIRTNEGFGISEKIDVTAMKELKISPEKNSKESVWNYFFLDANGIVISGENNLGSTKTFYLDVPDGATSFVCSYRLQNPIVINQTK